MKLLKIWAFLDNFFFHGFQWGTKGKMLKKIMYSFGNFSEFFLWSPIGNHEKKSCLNTLKFWEASRNHKRSLSWKFKHSILKNAETSHIPASTSENPVPLYTLRTWKGFSPVCVLSWLVRCWLVINFLPQNEHGYRRSFKWALSWVSRIFRRANVFPQIEHKNERTLLCVWPFQESCRANVIPHSSHLYGRIPECTH